MKQRQSKRRRMNKKLFVREDSLGTVYEGILMTPEPSRHMVLSQRPVSRRKSGDDSDIEESPKTYKRYPKGSYLRNAIETKERLSKELKKYENFGSPRQSASQAHPRLVRVCDRNSSRSDDSTFGDSDDEILTPFQATRGIVIEPPSYWFGCSYIHRPKEQSLNLTIRQTGVLPDFKYSKITLDIHLRTKKSKTQKVTLLKSQKDKSFRSSTVSFKEISFHQIQGASLVLDVIAHRFFSRKKVAQLKIPLNNCNAFTEKTEWSRIRRTQ